MPHSFIHTIYRLCALVILAVANLSLANDGLTVVIHLHRGILITRSRELIRRTLVLRVAVVIMGGR
jgi:hypothetical protein